VELDLGDFIIGVARCIRVPAIALSRTPNEVRVVTDQPAFWYVGPAIAGVGAMVGLASLSVSAAGLARQSPGAFKRLTGWLIVILGGIATVTSTVTWIRFDPLPWRHWDWRDWLLSVSVITGFGLAYLGYRRARMAPVDREAESLRGLAEEMLAVIDRESPLSGPFGKKRVRLRGTGLRPRPCRRFGPATWPG
jgi:hypothetical protein